MKVPSLEDLIIAENKNTFSHRMKKLFLDHLLLRNPFLIGICGWFGLEYLREKEFIDSNRNLDLLVSYLGYSFFGVLKEYYLEGREIKFDNLKDFIYDNPKIIGSASAVGMALVTYYAESNMPDVKEGSAFNLAIGHSVQFGVLSEAIIRGMKNLRRLKKNFRKIKRSLTDKAYNFILEHPMIITSYVFYDEFVNKYSFRYENRIKHSDFLTGNFLEDLLHHPGAMVSLAGRSSFSPALALGSLLLASTLIHSYAIKEHGLRLKKTFYSLFNSRKELEMQRKIVDLPNSIEKNIEDLVELGNCHYKTGERTEAFSHYRKALRLFSKKSDQISYGDFFRKTLGLNIISRSINNIKYKKFNNEESVINNVFISLLNKDRSAVKYAKNLVDKNPNDINLIYFYGKTLDIIGEKEKGMEYKKKAVLISLEKGKLEEILGSKNKVVLIKDELLNNEVIAKEGIVDDLENEITITNKVRKEILDYSDFDVPVPIGVISYNKKNYYVMEHASGSLLSERIYKKEANIEDFCRIADFMGLIHAKINPVNKVERNFRDNIKNRLLDSDINPSLVEVVYTNLKTLEDSLNEIVKVYNKDAHPRNWIRDEFGGYISIDLEGGRLIPLTFDTANLLGQYKIEVDEDKVIQRHVHSYFKYKNEDSLFQMNQYKIAYLDSLVVRAFEIYSQVRDKNKEVMFASIENAKGAINKIETHFNTEYKRKEFSYRKLYDCLEELKNIK